MTFSHEIKCIRKLNTESKSYYLFFLLSVQEIIPKSNNFLCFLFIVGRKCCISRTERKHVSMTKHKNRAYRELQTLCIHKAPSCTGCHSTGSPHRSIFVSSSHESIQPSILCQTATICVCCDKTTVNLWTTPPTRFFPTFSSQYVFPGMNERRIPPLEFVWFFYLLYLSSVGLHIECTLETEGMPCEITQEF